MKLGKSKRDKIHRPINKIYDKLLYPFQRKYNIWDKITYDSYLIIPNSIKIGIENNGAR